MSNYEPFKLENVRPLRKKLGWTQAKLANYLGITIFPISAWENQKDPDQSMRYDNSIKLWALADKHKIEF